jgi:hypothetical protein
VATDKPTIMTSPRFPVRGYYDAALLFSTAVA